ncbi:hypothetical protein AD930_06600 [Acetobacter malorum]|nr:hypothetical protein AD930_06600 [Acetobacter malorum]
MSHLGIVVEHYPQLKFLCWNRTDKQISRLDAFSLYDRNWRHVDASALDDLEKRLIRELYNEHGGGISPV